MKPALRKPLLALHLWTGIVAGLILVVVALSGCVLIFRAQFERRLDPQRFIVKGDGPRHSLDQLALAATAAHPAGTLESVRLFGDSTMPVMYLFSNKEYVHVDPHTGAILGTRQRYGEGFGWVEGIHKYLTLEPSLGENVNGSLAFVFAFLFGTGVILWIPATRRALVAGLTLNRKLKGRPWNLNLHKVIGAYAALILAFSALSGIPIALESTRAVIDFVTGSRKLGPVARPAAGSTGFVGFQAVADRIESLMPGATETYIALPKNGVVSSYAIAAQAPHPSARSYVFLDAATGKVLRFTPFEKAPIGFRAYYWLLALHTAVAGGILVKLLLLFATLSVPVLYFTGVASYVKRRFLKPAARSAAPAVTPAPKPASLTSGV